LFYWNNEFKEVALELTQWSAHTSIDGALAYLAQQLQCADK
jgi:hypothetical protein